MGRVLPWQPPHVSGQLPSQWTAVACLPTSWDPETRGRLPAALHAKSKSESPPAGRLPHQSGRSAHAPRDCMEGSRLTPRLWREDSRRRRLERSAESRRCAVMATVCGGVGGVRAAGRVGGHARHASALGGRHDGAAPRARWRGALPRSNAHLHPAPLCRLRGVGDTRSLLGVLSARRAGEQQGGLRCAAGGGGQVALRAAAQLAASGHPCVSRSQGLPRAV